MQTYSWNPDKNQMLIKERNISFERVVFHLHKGGLLDDVEHPNQEVYPHQHMYVVNIDNYVYLVPYVRSCDEVFLKTIIPSRKATRKYLRVKP